MTTISNKVRLYRYSDANAPVLSGTAGALIAILDACLVDGYDPKTINTLTVTGNNATAVISAGHTYEVGAVIRIAGATPAALNGDWRLASVTGTDAVFSVEGLGIAEGAATGTITALRAPAGWAKIYSDTNRAAYRSLDYADHNGMVLYIDDTGTTTARARGYESMSDIDTGVSPFPTDVQLSDGCWWGKSDAASSASRNWALVADSRRLTLCACAQSGYPLNAYAYMFGHMTQHHDSDAWAHIISGTADSSAAVAVPASSDNGIHVMDAQYTNNGTLYVARAASQLSGAALASASVMTSNSQTGSATYASATLTANLSGIEPMIMDRTTGVPRGRFSGPAHNYHYLPDATGFNLVGQPGNGALVMISAYSSRSFFLHLGTDGRYE